jgi:hypothetical protein
MEPGAATSGDEGDLRPGAGERRERHRLSRNRGESEKSQRPSNNNLHPRLSSAFPRLIAGTLTTFPIRVNSQFRKLPSYTIVIAWRALRCGPLRRPV